jgi:tRNA A37 threonylcarbamoyladenosine dehydratase
MNNREQRFSDRTRILLGDEGLDILAGARVAVYGLGGVGAACALDLVRAGVGTLHVVDFDLVETSNLNRLAFGTSALVGMPKTRAFAETAFQINPEVRIEISSRFFSGEEAEGVVDARSDIHADCIDSLNAKVNLIAALMKQGRIFIASMGTAGRLAPERLVLGSFSQSTGCPLAKSVRTRLRRMGIDLDFPAVWSDEPAVKPVPREGRQAPAMDTSGTGEPFPNPAAPRGRQRLVQGSAPFVPQAAGHIMASWIVRRLIAGRARPAML